MTAKTSLLPPMDLQEEEVLTQECKSLISSLPKENGWFSSRQYKYEGFWYSPTRLQQVITLQKHFLARDSDIILVTYPKSGTIWLKAIMFTLVNRKKYLVKENHPLLNKNPHELIPCFEFDLYLHNKIPDLSSIPSPRLFATHLPYFSLPKSVHNSASKLVYLCRNPKDTFVSLWHFLDNLRLEKMGSSSLDEAFDMFYKGVSPYGPFWDHILDYWNESKKNSDRILFLTYENMKEESAVHIKRLAEFLGCPFSAEEEESGMLGDIVKLCSFNSLSNLEIYKTGKLIYGQESKVFFRRGEIGDWKNFLSTEMVKKLDQITEHKLSGFGLKI